MITLTDEVYAEHIAKVKAAEQIAQRSFRLANAAQDVVNAYDKLEMIDKPIVRLRNELEGKS